MRSDPWGCAKWPKWAKMTNFGKRGKNGKKKLRNNERVPNFLLKINAPLIDPPHYAGEE